MQVHAHHAIQVSLALSGRVRLRGGSDVEWTEYAGAVVCSHHRHQFDGCGESVAQVFIEPETVEGRALLEIHRELPISRLPEAAIAPVVAVLRHALESRVPDSGLVAVGQQAAARLSAGDRLPRSVDPRITRAIEHVRQRRGAAITLAEIARVAHLSPGRFRHLFMEQTGISFRAYLLWTRIGSAIAAAMAGSAWTDAAQDWGFSDSAHLSRTCRRMFGIAPTMLKREGLEPRGDSRH